MSEALPSTRSRLIRRPGRLSARARFTIASTLLLIGVGALMLGVTSLAMRYVPTYDLKGGATTAASSLVPVTGVPVPTASVATVTPVGGVVISSASDVLNTLLVVSAVALVLIGAIGAWLSWIMAGRMLKPLRALSEAADRASSGSLDHRVGLNGPDDEFARVSRSFDDMLDRLERSFTAHERFAANASHELRTPLATTKTLLDVGRDDPAATDVPQLLERLSETNRRSLEIVEAMLDLSDIGQAAIETRAVEFSGVVEAELEAVAAEARAVGIRFSTDLIPVTAAGDSVLLRQLVANLLQNSVRHNLAGGSATVGTRFDRGAALPVVLTVSNTGVRVPDAVLTLLPEPFYRARGRIRDPRGSRGTADTHGLGLALVASIVDAHDGSIGFEALAGGGLSVTVRLPGAEVWVDRAGFDPVAH